MTDPGSGSSPRAGTPAHAAAASSKGKVSQDAGRWSRLRHEWGERLDPVEQSAVMSWAAFTTVFAGLRVITHWIHEGHGPKGGGVSLGGRHFHHYNIGIALLAVVGAVGLRGSEKQRRHPAVAIRVRVGNCAHRRRTSAVAGPGGCVLGLRRPQKRGCGGRRHRGRRDVLRRATVLAARAPRSTGKVVVDENGHRPVLAAMMAPHLCAEPAPVPTPLREP
jgi:hypothetical protein